ncbi:uncharacterized protein PF11_0213-like isoform X2 [Aricia agestis]|uniref:uncharacterized protein PF11_0213-like isoform X2 n=1 Tax=Aricia agestis TaxID=91739 RepID=UPI001C20B4E9|nr:uncharacterized protein PF11_0213-like isoform X2 [Aricia agestis]
MMSNSRIPSPARSLAVSTPRRYKQRRSRSVCSPGRLETSLKLTAMITDFVPSPLPNRRSVLNDDTEIIDMPKRKSWWRKLDENSRDVMELFEHNDIPETNNIEENFDVEILSQEKKNYTLDLPESSDGESINSIVIPQRKLFTQKENHPPKKFPRVFNNREELVKLQKSNVDHDNEIDVRPKSLFNQAKKPKTKPIFPSALLSMSVNKSIANKTREIPTVEPKGQVRSLFGNRPGTKRKNMFADFVVSESEDEVPDIQAKVFGFQKKSEQKRRVSARGVENSPTTSILDVDIDDWKQLPSSTMMENQIEDLAATPSKRTRLTGFIEPQETVRTNKELNKTKRNESLRSHKSKLSSSPPNVKQTEVNTSKTQKPKSLNKTLSDAQSTKLIKTYDADNGTEDIQNITSKGKHLDDGKVREHTKTNASKNTDNYKDSQEPIQGESDGENDFTLKYENDEDNLEQVENSMNKIEENINKNPPEEIQPNEEDKSVAHNLSVQAKMPKDINKSKNKSNASLVKATDINVSQNSKARSNHDISHAGSVTKEINKTRESGVKNKTIETIARNESVKEKYVVTVKNNTINSEGQVNNIMVNSSSNSKSLISQNDNNDESNTNKNKSINQGSKSSLSVDGTHDNEKSEESSEDNDDAEEMQNEDTSEESIQLDENETLNDGQEEEDEKNESSNEINETEKDTSKKAISLNAKELEQVIDKVDNLRENNDNLNKTDKNTEKSKINETTVDPPEAILFQQSKNFIESFTSKDEGKSSRKTKSMLKNNLNPSLAPVRDSTGFSDNTANSSGANSGWDSHRTTRRTLRKTFGKDFTPRKSLRTLVMEKSAKQRQTFNPDLQDISKHPRANSTELPGHGMNRPQEELDDETIENIQHALENKVVVKETPEGTQNDIADDDHMETEETVNKTQERSNTAESHMQTEESDNENAENSDAEASDDENYATENQQIEESDHANDTSNKEVEEESDHANDTSNNEQTEVESDHENDATDNPKTEESNHANDTSNKEIEEESDHANDTSNNEQTEVESDHENDSSSNQIEDEIDHANNTSNQHTDEESGHANNTSDQQTDAESDHDVSMNENADNQEVEDSDQEQSDNDTRDNRVDESDYNEISENKENTEMEQTAEERNYFSKSMKQRTLEVYFEKINKQDSERNKKLRENLMNTLKTNTHYFKVPAIPLRRNIKPIQKKAKVARKAMEVDDLPDEVIQDLKYKPPRRYKPKNASWATMRLYKYLETKLEPKYDYMARVRAEKLVNTLHEFVRHIKRHDAAPEHLVTALKHEMARLKIVDTHYEFYHFFHEFMPREIRVKVNPDIVNRIQLPKDVFSNIIRS